MRLFKNINMKKLNTVLTFLIFVILVTNSAQAQKKRVKIGILIGNYYSDFNQKHLKHLRNLSFDISYFLTEHLVLTTHVNYGKSRYFDDISSNAPEFNIQYDNTNAELEDICVGLMLGYKLSFTNWMSLTGSAGIGSYTGIQKFYWNYGGEYPDPIQRQYSMTDIAFPVKLSLGFTPIKSIEIAFASGLYLEPDYPIVGFHYGIQLSCLF